MEQTDSNTNTTTTTTENETEQQQEQQQNNKSLLETPKQSEGQSFISFVSELEKLEIGEEELIGAIIGGVLDDDLRSRLEGKKKGNLRLSKVIKMGLESEEYDVVSTDGLRMKMKKRLMCCNCCSRNKRSVEMDV